MLGNIVARVARSPLSLPLRRVMRRARESWYNTEVLTRLERKTAPIPLVLCATEPRRINILIPEIDFASFFGGYIAKFNLAKRLAERGHQVRIVMIDQCDEDVEVWRRCIGQYEGLEDFLQYAEVAAHFDRGRSLRVNPDDVIVATTWWSAYVAEAMRQELKRDSFVYLIQEYEPFTFAMGSWYAMAHASYAFAHRAMFSSALLSDYFRENQFGVFATDAAKPGECFSFENAIVRYTDTEIARSRNRPRPPWRLLFYARPEVHATRNMFEVGFLALRKAVAQGAFPSEHWQIHGIGTRHGDIDLGSGQTLKMLGKFGLEKYRATLLEYDVGLGLMYTPHPSLLPLEMAAAGMQVVTCECLNKNQAALTNVSSNMIVAPSTIDGVCQSLMIAARRAEDAVADAGTTGKRINWSSSWDDTFDEKTLKRIEAWIE